MDKGDESSLITSTNSVKYPINIRIPHKSGNIGIIDGQHRVFSYHEGVDTHEKIISQKREEQHLLVTGIRFPKETSEDERMRFQAQLFLEINDKQTRTNAALRQIIGTIINPFAEISIAKAVVNELAKRSPMNNVFEQHFFDKHKLKTTSIVSYGIRHITKLTGTDSLFHVWDSEDKKNLLIGKDTILLKQYVKFCADQINIFLNAFKNNIPPEKWTTNQKVSRVLTVTTITGLIHCMRKLILEKKKLEEFSYYNSGFKNIFEKIDFTKYKSSHWKDLGDEIYTICYK